MRDVRPRNPRSRLHSRRHERRSSHCACVQTLPEPTGCHRLSRLRRRDLFIQLDQGGRFAPSASHGRRSRGSIRGGIRQNSLVDPHNPLFPRLPPSLESLLDYTAQSPNFAGKPLDLTAKSRQLVCRARSGRCWRLGTESFLSGLKVQDELFVRFELGSQAGKVAAERVDQFFQCYLSAIMQRCIVPERCIRTLRNERHTGPFTRHLL